MFLYSGARMLKKRPGQDQWYPRPESLAEYIRAADI
jgi:hypothetical protein